MEKYIILSFLISFFSLNLCSQSLKAKVVDENNDPLVGATVYFDGTTVGVITDFEGNFSIDVSTKIVNPTLVITYLGYHSIYVKELNSMASQYQLKPKAEPLDNVTIYSTIFTRKQMEKAFLKYFLGEGKAANQSKIINLDDVILYYVAKENTLYASSSKPIQVVNKYLGYRVKFDLLHFKVNYSAKSLNDLYLKETFYAGTTYFQDINPNKKSQRNKVYKSSLSNYFKHLIDSTLHNTKFKIAYKGFVRNPYDVFKIVKPKDKALNINRVHLNTNYTKWFNGKFLHTKILHIYKGQQSVLTFRKPYFRVDNFGNLIDIKSIVLTGDFANNRVAKMLPLDFQTLE